MYIYVYLYMYICIDIGRYTRVSIYIDARTDIHHNRERIRLCDKIGAERSEARPVIPKPKDLGPQSLQDPTPSILTRQLQVYFVAYRLRK